MNNNRDGFSLMEFVVYTALLVLVVMFLFQFLLGSLNSQNRAGHKEEVINNALNAMNAIDFEIRHGQVIYEATSDFASDPGQLSLLTKKAAYPGESEVYVDIFIDSSQRLCIKKENLGTRCLTSDRVLVTSLDFDKIDLENGEKDGIKTALTIEYNTNDPDKQLSHSLESFTELRSY